MAIKVGTIGNNSIKGTAARDMIYGLAGNDTLFGSGGNDTLSGGDGNDVLEGGAGADKLHGGAGNDTFKYSKFTDVIGDTIVDFSNADRLDFSAITNAKFIGNAQFNGVKGEIRYYDSSVYHASEGYDDGYSWIETQAAYYDYKTTISIDTNGDAQEDIALTISTSGLTETAIGSRILISATNQTLIGTDSAETLTSGAGFDTLSALGGNDLLLGGEGNDILDGGDGADTLDSGLGNDALTGGDGNDVFRFKSPDDFINGDTISDFTAGDKIVLSFDGIIFISTNPFSGTPGEYRYDGYSLQFDFDGDKFVDQTIAVQGTTRLDSLIESGSGSNRIISYLLPIDGTAGNDKLTGSNINDTINGLAGNDSISGGDGNNSLSGGDGNDTLLSGSGNDTLDGGTGDDSISGGNGQNSLSGGDGNDILLSGDGDYDSLTGGDGNDTIIGGAGYSDSLTGGDGNDTIIGGAGYSDSLTGGAGNDVFKFNSLSEIINDYITDLAVGDTIDLSSIAGLSFAGIGSDFTGVANQVANSDYYSLAIDTNSDKYSDNSINLPYKTVVRETSTGSSIFEVVANQTLNGTSTNDVLKGDDGNDTLSGGGGDDTLLGLKSADSLTGDAGNDILNGGDGKDSLDGGEGNDVLIGGTNYDNLTGGAGNDIFKFQSLDDFSGYYDDIEDFTTGDKIDLQGIDANTNQVGDQSFVFTSAFSGTAGELVNSYNYNYYYNNDTYLYYQLKGDVNGDATADFTILITSVNYLPVATDFIL